MSESRPRVGSWQKELDDLARGLSGAFLFGVTLLFTMEMWWIGTHTEPWRLLFILALAFGVNLMLAYFAGFKREKSFLDNVSQAVESIALGAVASTAVLAALNQIQIGDPLDSVLGKIVLQTLPLSIGASAANALIAGAGNGGGGGEGKGQNASSGSEHGSSQGGPTWRATLYDIGKTVGGALFIGFSIAPTEEVPMLSSQLDYWHELALVGLTLLVSYLIVFESGFSRGQRGENRGPFQHPITETTLAYLVSLLVAFTALLVFSQVEFDDPINSIISETLVLGMPVAIGGAAGRALL